MFLYGRGKRERLLVGVCRDYRPGLSSDDVACLKYLIRGDA